MKKLIITLMMFFTISLSAQKNEPWLFLTASQDVKMSYEGPHGKGGVLNPEFTLGFHLTNNFNVWIGYEELSQINYKKFTYLAVDHKINIINWLETSYGLELSVIDRQMEKSVKKYTGPNENLSIGLNFTASYELFEDIHVFANTNIFTSEKYDNFGNEMNKKRWDVRIGFKVYVFKIP